MSRLIIALVALAGAAFPAPRTLVAQARSAVARKPPSRDSLAAIARRGRALSEYDRAARLAMEAVGEEALPADLIRRQLVRRTDRGWEVVFGQLAPRGDTLLAVHLATPGIQVDRWAALTFDPPRPDTGYYLRAARAIESALAMFRPPERVPYAATAIPAEDGPWWWVYVYPAATEVGVWPLGGDARFRVSADGKVITDSRHLHAGVFHYTARTARDGSTRGAVKHTAVGDTPEDTDVFHVLQRRPPLPEVVATKWLMYRIDVDGSIRYLGPAGSAARGR